ncbi:hypothetical protein ABZX39_11115 [Streptomyces collinus]|uniref:hypothetical protein n=1 Tax=Streptomyces collinus TaxID=42684 RepID=UPI0033BCB64F
MAAQVSGTFEYRITHVVSREGGPCQARTSALTDAEACRPERFAYRTLVSALLARGDGGPDVTRAEGRERGNVRHGWTCVPSAEDA